MNDERPSQLPEDPYEVVKAARAAIKERRIDLEGQVKKRAGKPYAQPSESTISDYEREAGRLLATENAWQKAAETTKKSTWLKRKSALLFVAAREVEALLKAQDRLQREMKNDPKKHQEWAEVILDLHKYSEILVRKPLEKELETVKKRQTKRRLGTLPDDWREQLAKRLPTWQLQYLTAAVTGCRPTEIGKGIAFRIEAGNLVATIKGAKTGLYSGQRLRELSWPIEKGMPELVRKLAKKVHENQGRLVVDYSGHTNADPAKAFSGAMREAAKRAWPGHSVNLTPYSLRHAAASDLKASGLDSAAQSAALGHQSGDTKSVYGSPRQARGRSVAPQAVSATTRVRVSQPKQIPAPVFAPTPTPAPGGGPKP